MRDTNEEMIELIDASKADNIYSATIRHYIGGERLTLRFGINTEDYVNLKKILQFRPYLNTGVGRYRYHFAMSYVKNDDDTTTVDVRVEQLNRHKQYKFTISQKLMANLLWFTSIDDKSLIKKMIIE